jgi:hypothetical protein
LSGAGREQTAAEKKKKKRKLRAGSVAAEEEATTADDTGDITLRVACLDGSSLDLKLPPRELVREVKRVVAQVRRDLCDCFCVRRDGHENNLIWYSLTAAFLHAAVVVFANDPPTRPFPTC